MNDDEVEDRLRDALRQFAGDAPPGVSMLTTVTAESGRRTRRVRLAVLASGTAALVAIGAAVPFALRGSGPAPAPDVVAYASPSAASPAPSRWVAPVSLVPSKVPTTLIFPVQAPTGDGYGDPMISLTAGRPTLLQTLPSSALATVTAYDSEPPPPAAKPAATPVKIAGTIAALYEETDRVSLVWHPAAGTWLRLDADPGTAAALLTAYAEALKPLAAKAGAPFTFRDTPAGWTVDNIAPAAITFAPPGVEPGPDYVGKLVVMLDEDPGREPKLAGPETVAVQVGDRRAWLTTTPEGQFLQIPVDGGRSLLLQIDPAAAMPTDVLLRFADGIGVTPAARVSHG